MKKMKSIFFLSSFLLVGVLSAQDLAYRFQIEGAEDTVIYLANYYGEKLYYADTARSDAKGRFGFEAIDKANQGKYAVVIPGPKYFEIIIADGEEIEMATDTANLTGNMQVSVSENNKLMYDYMNYLTEKRSMREELLKELEENEGKPEITARIKDRYNALNDEVIAHQLQLYEKNRDLFVAREIYMSVDPEVPEEIREDPEKGYYWFKRHYFDHIDLNDDRIVRTPVFHTKLVTYLNKTLLQTPDTIIPAVDRLIAKLDPDSEVFKYVVHYTTYNYETSKIMGLDEVFVHMVDTYYKTGKAYWMDEEKLKNIIEKADTKRKTLIGKKSPDLTLADSSGNWISIFQDLNQRFVVLYFYDPDCGHCKKETPKLVEFYNNYEEDDLAVYAVSAESGEKWTKFIEKNEMSFYNVAIPKKAFESAEYATGLITSGKTNYESLKFQETYDIFSTPKVFVLDEERIIRAKDIGVEQIGDFLDRFKGNPGKETGSSEATDEKSD
jgi:peroxiredoxin